MYRAMIHLALFLLCPMAEASDQLALTAEMIDIRASADGAGPSHLFWMEDTQTQSGPVSIVGVVDPLLSAVRFFRWAGARSTDGRVSSAGACALPIGLRPWQIHHADDAVLIESMPAPGADGYLSNRRHFTSRVYRIDRGLASRSAVEAAASQSKIDQPGWNPDQALQCGRYLTSADGSLDGPVGRAAPSQAARGRKNPRRTIVLINEDSALAPTGRLIVRAVGGNWLYSAKELEPAAGTRVVQITEGVASRDGIVRTRQRILAYRNDALISEWDFDETLMRSKLGSKPVAILPSGEMLAMGMVNKEFRIQTCGSLYAYGPGTSTTSGGGVCNRVYESHSERSRPDGSAAAHQAPIAGQAQQGRAPQTAMLSAKAIFRNLRAIVDTRWSVRTDAMPEACRSISGCRLGGRTFVPLRGIRLTRGVYTKTGLPYAMTDRPDEDVQRFVELASTGGRGLTNGLDSIRSSPRDVPGNLDDVFAADIGIDCSALVQYAWGAGQMRDRLSTSDLQSSPPRYVCPARLPAIEYLRAGDAISVNIASGTDPATALQHKGTNHVVLYASTVKFDDANHSWLVLESSSSCDGVCWSVYDPAFFNGWGLYRASGREDARCTALTKATSIEFNPIPRKFSLWRDTVADGQ
ncbi:MAG: hypothetical protein E6Q88_10430 [Lysobacteraceae bacterium]|nr:MAG: hypothetical protein E6Q88_10430 [Xanthomonadaceae bacterium]